MSDINRTETGTQQPMQKPTQPQPRTQPTPQTANGTHMGDFEVHPHASAPEAHTQTRSAHTPKMPAALTNQVPHPPAAPRAAHSEPQNEQATPRATPKAGPTSAVSASAVTAHTTMPDVSSAAPHSEPVTPQPRAAHSESTRAAHSVPQTEQAAPRATPKPSLASAVSASATTVHTTAPDVSSAATPHSEPVTPQPRTAHSVPQTEQAARATTAPKASLAPAVSASATTVHTAPRATTANTLHDVPSTSPNTLRVTSLYKSFGKKQAVRGVDFAMNTGEVLGLLGPNGAGKTTTFYMIVGFYRPTSGDVFCGETRITDKPMYKRARMGISYLPQDASVFRKLTVEQNIWAILEKRRDISRAEKKRKLDALIDEFSIGHIRKQPAYTLSGGERRRTEIARSLAIEPEFLLLDEPFAGIDPIAVADIKAMVRLLSRRGIGVLITDHNVRDTLEITDRAIIISSGEIVAQGSRDDILASPVARKIYLGEEFKM